MAIEFHDDDDDDDFYDYDDDAGVVKGDGRRTSSSSSSHDDEDDGRPRRRHRLTLVRRRIPAFLVAAVVAFVVLLVMTIALSLRRSDEALALAAEAEAESEALASGSTTTGGVISSAEEEEAGATAGDDFGGYHVGIAMTSTATTTSSTIGSTTTEAAPVDDEPDVGGPIWYSTTRRHYHEILAYQGELHNVSDIDPHDVANAYCRRMGKELCDYAAYCPDGRGSVPYGGGPPIDTTGDRTAVWAPFVPSGGGRMTVFGDAVPYWVQVGSIPVDGGGTDANDFASCWAYADWNDGGTFGDIEDVLGERRRLWMLCCEVWKDEVESQLEKGTLFTIKFTI